MLTKIRLALSILVLLIIAALVIVSVALYNTVKDANRYKTNYESVLKDKAIQQQMSLAEFKELYAGYAQQIKELKEYGVKLKNVENLIHVSYIVRDSLVYRDTLIYVYDTIREENYADFTINGNCWQVKGNVCDNYVEITDHQMQDSILILLYRQKKKCMFERTKVRAIAYSQRTGDTLAILNNLKTGKLK